MELMLRVAKFYGGGISDYESLMDMPISELTIIVEKTEKIAGESKNNDN